MAKKRKPMTEATKRKLRALAKARRKAARLNKGVGSTQAAKKKRAAPKRKKHAKAHAVYARDLGQRVRNLEAFKERQEKWNHGVATWARAVSNAMGLSSGPTVAVVRIGRGGR